MKKSISNFASVVCAAGLVVLMSACHSKDLYDEEMVVARDMAQKEVKVKESKLQFASLFKAKYGEIKPNQTWDFSSGTRQLAATRGASDIKTELVSGFNFRSRANVVTKNEALYNALKQAAPDKASQTGKPVVLIAPGSTFYVIPISTRCKDTHRMVVNPGRMNPVVLYQKTWDCYDKHYVNGMSYGNTLIEMPGVKVDAPLGTPVEIYISQVGGSRSTCYGTDNGRATYLDMPADLMPELPSDVEVGDNPVIRYIGIEDGDDQDYNDVVLMLVGAKNVPQETIVTENEYVVNTAIGKRYMIEDLGNTDDFDFNDVVVDVTKNFAEYHKVTYENGQVKRDEVVRNEMTEKAVVRALGGSLDVTLKIGNTTWSKSKSGLNTATLYNTYAGSINPEAVLAEFEVSGWEPTLNNISVTVDGKDNQGIYEIGFPKAGDFPMMMAFDLDHEWSNERVSIPASWLSAK